MSQLIVALEPGLPVVERLLLLQEDLNEPLRQLGAEVQWTAPDQLRMVLRTVPLTQTTVLDRLRDQLRAVARSLPAPTLGLRGAGFEASEQAPRILFAGLDEEDEQLMTLRKRVWGAIDDAGHAPELRPWLPRVLVGRLRTPRGPLDLEGVLRRYESESWGSQPVRELVLLQSTLQGGVARTRILERIAFGTGR